MPRFSLIAETPAPAPPPRWTVGRVLSWAVLAFALAFWVWAVAAGLA